MNFILVFYISVFLRMRFACASLGDIYAPFPIAQLPPTQPDIDSKGDVEENPFHSEMSDINRGASGVANHSDSTTAPMSLTTNITLSPSPTNALTTANITVLPETLTTRTTKRKRQLLRENRRRCNKLQTYRLRSTCRAIVENSLRDTDYLYVVTDDDDLRGLKRQLVERGVLPPERSFDFTPILPGDQSNCKSLTCPTTKDWLRGTFANERSTSPWIFCDNYDPDRIPAWINIAKCRCKNCKDRSMEGENSNYVSQEIKRHMRVIRKDKSLKDFSTCTNSKLCWDSIEAVAVGCHCMMPDIY